MPYIKMLRVSPVAMAALLSACGGGGSGVNSTPPPPTTTTPTTPTTPPPPPPPPPTNYDTAEYQRSNGATSVNALKAYQSGATGSGINVGVVDSGINASLPDFAGRVHSASSDTAGNSSYTDEDGHGTAVAGVIAANKNDSGHHGIAFNASLVVMRADSPGSCATEKADDPESGCSFSETAIADGINKARIAGAKVINVSLGGDGPIGTSLRNAVSQATGQGIIIIVSAGNDGDKSTGGEPDGFATAMVEAGQRGLVLIAGALDTDNASIADFSNRAGSGGSNYITALGTRVRTVDHEGTATLWSGTSFSAPVVTGAIALLRQAFPNLTPEQVVQLVYSTARDLGDPGIDGTYGRGGLDLTRAFQPVGTTNVAGTTVVVSDSASGVMAAPMGDAGAQASLPTIITDSYNRAFAAELSPGLSAPSPAPTLWAAMQPSGRHYAVGAGATTFAVAVSPFGMEQASLNTEETRLAMATAATITQRLGKNATVAFGFSQSANGLVAQAEGRKGNAFLIGGAHNMRSGFATAPDSAIASSYTLGKSRLTLFAENGDVLTQSANPALALRGRYDRNGYTMMGLSAQHRTGPADISVVFSQLNEKRTLLGSNMGPFLGAHGADSWFVDANAAAQLGEGWRVGISGRHGWTRANSGGLITGGMLRSRSWALDVAKAGLFGNGSLALRYAEPLRVYNGGLTLSLPSAYDYSTGTASFAPQQLALTPKGHARDWEAVYSRAMWGGTLSVNGYYRTERANIVWMPDESGAVMSYTKQF